MGRDITMDNEATLKLPARPISSLRPLLQVYDTPIDSSLPQQDTPVTRSVSDDLTATIKLPRTPFTSREKLGDVQVRVVPADDYVDMVMISTPSLSRGMKRRQSSFLFRCTILLLLVIIGSSVLLYSGLVIPMQLRQRQSLHISGMSAAKKTVAINGANRWVGDTRATVPAFNFSQSSPQGVSVSPLFEDYYNRNSVAQSLGVPVTVAFPTAQGWLQFFRWGALLLPIAHPVHPHNAENALVGLISTGARDPSTGIIRLPLLQALLTVGSQVPIGGSGSPLTFVDLRQAANPDLMRSAPAGRTVALSPVGSQDVFVKGGTRAGKEVGHLIPQALWSYINRSGISPDGWKTDFGAPLTEALSFTITKNGYVHHMLVQAFWRDGVVLDQDTLDSSGHPQIQRLDTGIAYLHTVGPPNVVIHSQQTIWVQGDTALLNAPGTGYVVAHVGQHFPLTLLGNTAWNTGMLWYHIQWAAPKHTGTAWVQASDMTFTSPGTVPGWASLDALSPDLAAYLASIGDTAGAVVYDVTHKRYYTYHANTQFITASSMKIPILLTFLDMTERQGREPNDQEMDLLTTMIENSNNDSASALFYGEIGGAVGVASFLQRIGISDLHPNSDSWGYSQVSPLSMVNLLTRVYEGTILTAHDCSLVVSLMEQVESDQQAGVGDTAPDGATVAMKDGWVLGPDGLWAMNSSGVVTLGQETYIIAVYTQEQSSLEDGQAISRHVCGTIASLLM